MLSARLRIVLASQFNRFCWSTATAKLHNAPFQKVQGSHSAKAAFCALHRCAPSRVSKKGVMQNCLRWSGLVSRLHSPAASRLTCSRLSPLWCAGAVALVRRYALCFGQWPSAIYLVSAPAHPWGLLASRDRPRGLPVHPPRGSLDPRSDRKRRHHLPRSSAYITGKFAESAYIHRYIAGKEKTPPPNR